MRSCSNCSSLNIADVVYDLSFNSSCGCNNNNCICGYCNNYCGCGNNKPCGCGNSHSCGCSNNSCNCGSNSCNPCNRPNCKCKKKCNCRPNNCGCNSLANLNTRICIDTDGTIRCVNPAKRDPFWPAFCSPRCLSCADLYNGKDSRCKCR